MEYGFQITKTTASKKVTPAINPANESGVVEINESPASIGFNSQWYNFDEKFTKDRDQILRYRSMSYHPELDSAISDIVDEAIVLDDADSVRINLDNIPDQSLPKAVKKKIIEEFKRILELMSYNKRGKEWFRKWYIDGRLFLFLDVNPNKKTTGIQNVTYIDPLFIKKFRKTVSLPNNPALIDDSKTEEFYVYAPWDWTESLASPTRHMRSGLDGLEKDQNLVKIPVDAVVQTHSGLMDESRKMVLSYLHKAHKPLNQLRIMEDALVIYRIARAPERRAFYVDVGDMNKSNAENYINSLIQKHRSRTAYNPDTGEIKSQNAVFAMMEDYWLPRRDGQRGTEIDTISGGQNLGDIEDIIYFKERLYQALNVPRSRMEADSGFVLGRASEISRDELKFTKFVKGLRTTFSSIFTAILQRQLILKGIMDKHEFSDIREHIAYQFNSDSYFTELKEAEIIKERFGMLRDISEYAGRFVSDRWIRKNILRQTDEEIEQLDKEIAEEKANKPEEEEGGGGKSRW